jgi:uncharacterized protein (TIGR00369 family)
VTVDGERHTTLSFLATPGDANFGGKVHGGSVMRWIDEAGYACAAAWSGRHCVTAFVGEVDFARPITIGSLVRVHARVVHTGRTSMHVYVEVSSADPMVGNFAPTTRCFMVFVSVDEDGHPVPVPPFVTDDEADQTLAAHARQLHERRHRAA